MVTPLPRPTFTSTLGSLTPPRPLPRYMRPGGYAPGYTGEAEDKSFLGGVHKFLTNDRVSDMLQDLGYGLMRGTNFSEALALTAEQSAAMRPYRDERYDRKDAETKAITDRETAARNLAKYSPEFQPIADMVAAGMLDPKDAWNQAFKLQTDQRQQEIELQRARANAAFIKDPDLKAMVEAGAIPFKDAYDYERGGGSNGKFGDTVMLGRDAEGNAVPLRTAPGGGLAQAPLPEGITFDPGGMAGARTFSTIDAKTQGAAQQALPGAEQNVTIALKAVERLRGNKQGQDEQFGSIMGVIPNRNIGAWKGTEMANFQTDLAQAGGQAFMQARNALKGGGQITDFEGRRAEDAITAMQKAAEVGDQETFNAALDEFEAAIIDGYAKLQQVANGTYQPTFMPAQPGGSSGGPAASGDYVTRYGLEQ